MIFAKVRRGPQLRAKIATLPADGDAAPRLELVGDVGRPEKPGTEDEAMANWIAEHDEPVAAAVLRARFDVSETTLRERRRAPLEQLGIRHARLPGRGNTYAYGTDEQWRELELGGTA